MSDYLGFDTSNYTTSAAIIADGRKVLSSKKLLPVQEGEKGLRQSDAVFHHTKQMPEVIEDLFSNYNGKIDAVGSSSRPCDSDRSYMPCFLVGKSNAFCVSNALGVPFYEFSHQSGHIAAALYSCGRFDLFEKEFIAFHFSGGTSQALLVKPDKDRIIIPTVIASTLDLNAGQLVDRVGVMLGLRFPCGKELEKLALQSDRKFKINVKLKDGNCCLSGIENQCRDMINNGESSCDVAMFCLENIKSIVDKMTEKLLSKYSVKDLIYAGGVMSDSVIRDHIQKKYNGCFASPEYSCDNAAGIAVLTYLSEKNK